MTSETLLAKYKSVRQHTLYICESLEPEDCVVQPMQDVSPPKWHLAHSTWFFEQFVLSKFDPNYTVYDPDFSYLFNSYYNHAGDRVLRADRGLMTRPSVSAIKEYRKYVDEAMVSLLQLATTEELLAVVTIGLNHEQQHQELLLYDIKYILGNQVLMPSYHAPLIPKQENAVSKSIAIEEGLYDIGHQGTEFCFDNELPQHKVFLQKFSITNRLVTQGEYLAFMEAGGYQSFQYWLAEGWDFIQKNALEAPLYWHKVKDQWHQYTQDGLVPIDPDIPVTHISFYEASAYALWKGMRLPTEFEWEVASQFFEHGTLWEWTNSAYLPYPGYTTAPGALGEYNGKFMLNLNVLRGGSFGTPKGHSRPTYRNFFHASSRWIFSGIRLAH